jgi:hypothetical protein
MPSAEGKLVLSASPSERLFALAIGSEADYLDREKSKTELLRKFGILGVSLGGLTAAGTVLITWFVNSTIDSNRRK